MKDKVMGSHCEIGGFNVDTKHLRHFPRSGSAFRHLLDGPNTLVCVVAEQEVRGHETTSLIGWATRTPLGDYAMRALGRRMTLDAAARSRSSLVCGCEQQLAEYHVSGLAVRRERQQ